MDLRIASCQFPVSHEVAVNSNFIQKFMRKASVAGADVVLFPECALSGYGRSDLNAKENERWNQINLHLENIRMYAAELGIWAIFGTAQPEPLRPKPVNCMIAVSDKGETIAVYAKRRLTQADSELYSPGDRSLLIDINGVKCGFLICYELNFPELFVEYAAEGVSIIFHSAHNVSRKTQRELEALTIAQLQTRAADYQLTIVSSNSSARNSFSRSCIVEPNGSLRSIPKHKNGLIYSPNMTVS